MPSPFTVVVWTCVVVFILTAGVTFLALIGRLTLGSPDGIKHHEYLKWLVGILVVEIVSSSAWMYTSYGRLAIEQMEGIARTASISLQGTAGAVAGGGGTLVGGGVSTPRQQKLRAQVYATSDGKPNDEASVTIPPGWRLVERHVEKTTENGNVMVRVSEEKDNVGNVVIKITAHVVERGLFGPNNWVGAILVVSIEETTPRK